MGLNKTGKFITEAEMKEIKTILSGGGTVQLKPKSVVVTTPAKLLAEERLAELAAAYGLPKLKNNWTYGLTSDREFVWKEG